MTSRELFSIHWLGGVFVVGLALLGACNRPPAAPEPRLHPTEATVLQAPFVLRLQGPPSPPSGAGTLSLEAVLDVPPGLGESVPIVVEVTSPEGALLINAAARQVVSLGGATRQARLPLSFQLSKPLGTPISVRASLERGEAMRAVAERFYPEPTPTSPTGSEATPAAPSPLPGIPVVTPKETVR